MSNWSKARLWKVSEVKYWLFIICCNCSYASHYDACFI